MNRIYAYAICGILCIVGWVGAFEAGRGTSPARGETSCAALTDNYLTIAAATAGAKIRSFKLLACHTTGDSSVARVQVVVRQVLLDPFTGEPHVGNTRYVFVFHLEKTPWTVVDVHPVS